LIPAELAIACRALPGGPDRPLRHPLRGRINSSGADRAPRVPLAGSSDYSPSGRDLEDLAIADLGDCELATIAAGARPTGEIAFWQPGLPVMLGGDPHPLPVIEVLAPAVPDLRILQLDAHPDLREEFLGERYNYASAMARVMDVVAPERVFQVGMRPGPGGVPAEGAAPPRHHPSGRRWTCCPSCAPIRST
jgi:arginase family enzyme